MRWTVHGERSLYDSNWVSLALVDVEVPGGERFEHHVVRYRHEAAGVVVHDPDRGVLLLWRHRFITDAWGWEIPAGGIEPGEDPAEAGRREVLEETGYGVGTVAPLLTYFPSNGSSDQVFRLFTAQGATQVAEPTDPGESERIEWVPAADLAGEIAAGRIVDG